MKNILTTIGILGALVLGFLGFSKPSETVVTTKAVSSPDVYNHSYFYQGLTEGGAVSTTSLVSTYTLSRNDIGSTPTVVQWTPSVNTTISITATSTFDYVPKIGDAATIYFRNASSTAGSSITFAAANANVDLQFSEATGGDLVLNGLDWAKMTFIRSSLYQVAVIFDEFTEAD